MWLVILNQVELIMFEYLYPDLHRPIENKSTEQEKTRYLPIIAVFVSLASVFAFWFLVGL